MHFCSRMHPLSLQGIFICERLGILSYLLKCITIGHFKHGPWLEEVAFISWKCLGLKRRSHQKFPPILSFKKTININKNIINQWLRLFWNPWAPRLFEVRLKNFPKGPNNINHNHPCTSFFIQSHLFGLGP